MAGTYFLRAHVSVSREAQSISSPAPATSGTRLASRSFSGGIAVPTSICRPFPISDSMTQGGPLWSRFQQQWAFFILSGMRLGFLHSLQVFEIDLRPIFPPWLVRHSLKCPRSHFAIGSALANKTAQPRLMPRRGGFHNQANLRLSWECRLTVIA